MPAIQPDLLKSVAFVYVETSEGLRPSGTGFFFGQRAESPNTWSIWFVTARHVVTGHDRHVVRLDHRDPGEGSVHVLVTGWQFPADPAIDLAWVRVRIPLEVGDYRAAGPSQLVRRSQLEGRGIGMGDETFLLGLLPQHVEARNTPVVRHGHLAMLPTENVRTPFGMTSMYLVEMGAFPGQSGAPVWVFLSPAREPGIVSVGGQRLFLVGVMLGFYQVPMPVEVVEVQTSWAANQQLVRGHAGISLVTPIDAFLDAIPPEAPPWHEPASDTPSSDPTTTTNTGTTSR